MRKLLAFAALSMILVSCENQEAPAAVENTEPTIIGSSIADDGKTSPLVAGDTALEQIWLDYIVAHNDRNLEKIAAPGLSQDPRSISHS